MATVEIVSLFESSDSPTECSAAAIEIGFRENEVPDLVSQPIGSFYGNGSAHAVSIDIYSRNILCVDKAANLQGMVTDAIAEIIRAITVAKAEEIEKDKLSSTQGGCERHMGILE